MARSRLHTLEKTRLTILRSLDKSLTEAQYEQAVTERGTFGEWMRTAALPAPADGQSLDKMMIRPRCDTEPFDRHQYFGYGRVARHRGTKNTRSLEEGASKKQGFGHTPDAITAPWLNFLHYTL
jgi:hypothetical protein